MHQRTQPVGDDDHGTFAGDLLERCADALLGRSVDRRCRVVEDDHLRPEHQATSNRKALPLPAGKRNATFSNEGVVLPRKTLDPVMQLRLRRRPVDCLVFSPGVTVGDVVLN